MSLRLGCSTAGTAFGRQNIASSKQPKQRSQRLNSSCSRHAPTHIEQWISSISAELQILLPLEYPWLQVAKPCFLLVRYCMLLTRHSVTDSCTAVFKLHAADTMQNIAFALFTLHVAHNLSSFFILLSDYMWLWQNLFFADLPLHVDAYCRIGILLSLHCLWPYIVKTL